MILLAGISLAPAVHVAEELTIENLLPVKQRFANRTFPSVFMAWNPATNVKDKDPLMNIALHDLAFVGPGAVGLIWNQRPIGLADGFQPNRIRSARTFRARLQSINPNLILLMELRYRDASKRFLPDDHPWWKRDQKGSLVTGWEEGDFLLLDFQNPQFRSHVAKRAKAAMDTGVFDGVMLDWWIDDRDRLALAKVIREAIGEQAIILVNANDRKTPNTAPYVNGYFMECWRSKTREDWDRIAETLRFAEEHLRQPRLNCVETWYDESRRDLNRMRATTCLVLTQSDGYCLFSDPNELPSPDHLHDWYPFWQKRLGKPISQGVLNVDGSARREFQHGTAVYNPIGNPPLDVVFDEPQTSLSVGKTARIHTVPPLDGDIFLNHKITHEKRN